MRVCVIGAGVAGALLAWRLAQLPEIELVVLAPGPARPGDATAASGGSVRAFELSPAQSGLAIDSMTELLADPTLRDWAGFVECGSVYLPADPGCLPAAIAEIEASLPGSASLLDADELTRQGWAGLDAGVVGVLESRAGYLSPQRLRRSVLADLVERRSVRMLAAGEISDLRANEFTLDGVAHQYDIVVLAAGAWTPSLLSRFGYRADGLRTKGIQYTVHRATGGPTTTFVDDLTHLFGRPTPEGVLLGLPTDVWDVSPASFEPDLELSRAAAELAGRRLPGLRLQSAATPVTAMDCYADDGLLSLRPVSDTDDRLFTFTGGTGSAAKTVLAASRRAAIQLANPCLFRLETPPILIGRSAQTS
jgi:glycine/D-amino acid oxidase-like deaminating enzyme